MKKKIWDLYAPIYEKAMRADANIYEFMYARIPKVIRGKEVLEIATGPGLLAKHVAPAAKRMVATDYSDGMIREANKGERPSNLTFEVADATELSKFGAIRQNLLFLCKGYKKAGQERTFLPGFWSR